MAFPSYKEETIQFLSSYKLVDDTSLHIEDENRGVMHFKVHGKVYQMPVAQLNGIFNFPRGGTVYSLDLDMEESLAIWSEIAEGSYIKGSSKGATIRNPILRYAHTFLANTLFARREKGGVKEEEFVFLIEGIKRHLRTTPFGGEILGEPHRINYAHFFARRILEYQEWASITRDKTPLIAFGGLITPILLALNVPLAQTGDSLLVPRIDAEHLQEKRFIAGRIDVRYGYSFKIGEEKKVMLLPFRAATDIDIRTNIIFKPKPFQLYSQARHGQLHTLRAPRGPPPTALEDEEEEPVYGSARYEYRPYEGAISSEALRNAHENISMLNRFIKWQNKTIKKMAKGFKKQKEEIKELKAFCFNLQRSPRHDDPHPLQLPAPTQDEGAGTSSSAPQQRTKAPISPSSSGSGNPAYSLGGSSDSD